MSTDQPKFIDELTWRGLIQSQTPAVADLFDKGQVHAYIGFDPTADSIHVGNWATLMLLVHLQRCGHKPVLLVGGATGMIGDPSGKSAERNLLTAEQINHNVECVKTQLMQFLDFEGPNAAQVLNNYDWFGPFGYLTFLREVGKHLTLNYMMAKDSVQSRMETGISYTEFSYQLLQAYDFYYLQHHHGVKLQMGGSDQWGNITSGIELIRRIDGKEAHGLTCPLLTKADGTKFGKSEQGNIWLDAEKTSPYKFYQFWLNAQDADVAKLLKVFSLKPRTVIEETIAAHEANPGARTAQMQLAEELTSRIHGAGALAQAKEASKILFGKTSLETMRSLSAQAFEEIFEGVPRKELPKAMLADSPALLDLLVEVGATDSKGAARRLIKEGGVKLNKQAVQDQNARASATDLLNDRYMLLQVGKKKYYVAVFMD